MTTENNNGGQTDDLSAYDYTLPEELIAQMPLRRRTDARMMVIRRDTAEIEHRYVRDIAEFFRPGDALVLNNTKVVPARLIGRRVKTGGKWEGLFLRFDSHGIWEIMSKTRGKLLPGEEILLEDSDGGQTQTLRVYAHTPEKTLLVQPLTTSDTYTFLNKVGWVPIPPYIRSGRMIPEDRENYQTVYARAPGAIAAPTAGLHFSTELLAKIAGMGVELCPVTLHVGAGTFRPIKTEKISQHRMHEEFATIDQKAVDTILRCRASGGRVIAVGTTSVRTLESAANASPDGKIDSTGNNDYQLRPFSGPTDLFIRPPYRFKVVDALLTNFHLPKSTLLILVRTFGGDELMKRAYEEAIRYDYRFYSYGDCMLIL
ncbi:MAG: tRNA preQ1(34) S-adenosylmethionine ribosyltransferase-isomerase QueA [Thermoguttaceae bacterium]|nr:tRNA preQ1(34) S-adenosylmethionine ribosyltransferase-isomerase QueA [Thermoguttaceae bacterium]